MVKRKCPECKEFIYFTDKENSVGAVFYDKKYYHKDCFVTTCNRHLKPRKNKKESRLDWGKALNEIPKLQENAKKKLKDLIEKDDFYNFALTNYQISAISDRVWERLAHIHDGTYEGVAYPISFDELLEEWKFFMPELVQNRAMKNIVGPSALAYDLAIILNRNAEYREIMEKRKVEEQVKAAQRNAEVEIDAGALAALRRHNSQQRITASRKRAELFKEVMDDGN